MSDAVIKLYFKLEDESRMADLNTRAMELQDQGNYNDVTELSIMI